jgi:hypothetical protein
VIGLVQNIRMIVVVMMGDRYIELYLSKEHFGLKLERR